MTDVKRFWFLLGKMLVAGFVTNWIWEMLQMAAYREMVGRSWSETAARCAASALVDVGILAGVYTAGAIATRNLAWGVGGGWNVYAFCALLGFLCAVQIERQATLSGNWSYTSAMPMIPVLDTGLWPVLQLALLTPFSVWIGGRFVLRDRGRRTRENRRQVLEPIPDGLTTRGRTAGSQGIAQRDQVNKVPVAQHDSPSECNAGCSCSTTSGEVTICPECRTVGTRVELITLKALLRPRALRRLEGTDYHFCPAPHCDVVYFDSGSGSRFRKTDLLIRIGQKESEDPIPVCYCFDFTIADLRRDLATRGETSIPEAITQEIRAGHCACEVKNPEGSCCLGNVREAVKRIRSGIG